MTDREFLLTEAIRRLECAYSRLWAITADTLSGDTVTSIQDEYDLFNDIMNDLQQRANPVPLTTATQKG